MELPALAALQPSFRSMQASFLGWTEDETQFALKVVYATAWTNMDAGPATYEVFEVHDTLSGKLAQSFKIATDVIPDKNDKHAKLWKQARSSPAWKPWLRAHPLTASTSSVQAGEWSFNAKVADESPAKGDRFELFKKSEEFSYSWTIHKGESDRAKPPKVEVSMTKGTFTATPLVYTLPFKIKDFYEEFEGEIHASGSFAPFVSPSQTRVVFMISSRLLVDNEAFPSPVSMFFMRTLGPQIKIIDSAQTSQARALAQALAKENLPVTVVEAAKTEAVATDNAPQTAMLYYRNISDEAKATLLAAVPGIGSEQLQKPGWLDAIIVLP